MKRTGSIPGGVCVILATSLWWAWQVPAAWAFGALYRLETESHYIEGCYEPCMCPILMNQTLQGGFMLSPIRPGDDGSLFAVEAVAWQLQRGDETVAVTGSGQYRIDGELQRMSLDLRLGDAAVQHFDSGLVPLEVDAPAISIAVALNGFFCYDQVFAIAALPVPVELVHRTWGSLKSVYR